ncbi:MAG: energy transducer TonB [Leptospiraceae bacterium]|nr:energy transducer TonB [Leptospiraceae bacterium]
MNQRNKLDTLLRRGTIVPFLWIGSLSASAFALQAWTVAPDSTEEKRTISAIHFQLASPDARQSQEIPDRRENATGKENPSSSQSATSEGKNQYLSQVLNRIEAHKRYPLREKQDNIEGSVKVHFRISSSGQLLQVSVAGPSPVSSFNVEAMSCIKRASPFPPFPEDMKQDSVALTIRMDFRLR